VTSRHIQTYDEQCGIKSLIKAIQVAQTASVMKGAMSFNIQLGMASGPAGEQQVQYNIRFLIK